MNLLFKSEIIDYEFLDNNKENTILFLHGWGGNKDSFISTIRLLKSKYNIITLTMPTISPTNTIWTLHDYASLIEHILLLHSIREVIIICHSFGFRVSALLNHKIKIKKLVVTGGAGLKKTSFLKRIIKNNNLLMLNNKNNKFLYKRIASPDYQMLSNINKETFKNVVNLNTKNLIKFDCPMLLFWGQKDTATPLYMCKKIKTLNIAKEVITNSDHFAYIKENNLFNHEIMEFLR